MVGGGLAGMTAAATASRPGPGWSCSRPTDPAAGPAPSSGRASSSTWAGMPSTPPVPGTQVLRSLGITPRRRPRPSAATGRSGGVQHLLPTGPGSLLRTGAVGPRGKVQLAAPPRPGAQDQAGDVGPHLGGRLAGLVPAPPRRRGGAPHPDPSRGPTPPTSTDSVPMPPSPSCRWRPTAGCSTCTVGGASSSRPWPACSTSGPGPRSPASSQVGRRVEVRTRAERAGRRPGGGGHRWPGRGPHGCSRPTRDGATSGRR